MENVNLKRSADQQISSSRSSSYDVIMCHKILKSSQSIGESMRKVIITLLLFLVPALTLYILWPSDEGRIKKLFKEGAGSMESEDPGGVMAKVSFNYRDEYGMTYLTLRETLEREFKRISDVHVEYDDLKIQVFKNGASKGALAEMDVRVVATIGSETGYIAGDVKKPLHLRFALEKERMKWLIVKTEGF